MESSSFDGQLVSLPGRYARTLFDLAVAEHKQSAVHENLDHFLQLYETVEEIKTLFDNPTLRRYEQLKILQEVAQHYGYEDLFAKFLYILSENRRLPLFPSIRELFISLRQTTENVQNIEIFSAVKLKKEQQQKLQHILAHQFTSQLNFSYHIDPALLGGFWIKIGSQIVDLTVRHKLNMLVTEMKGNA